jgi:hypothetical protein
VEASTVRSTLRALALFVFLLGASVAHADGYVSFNYYGAAPQYGKLAAASVTGTSVGTCNALVTLSADRVLVQVFNSLNQTVDIAYNGAQVWELEAGESFVLDLRIANFGLKSGKTLCVWAPGTAPTTGTLRATLF